MTGARPLSDLRVLDFTWVGAGALATKLLADLGADVIKVESRKRPDNLRLAPPYRPGAENLEGSGYFASRNSSKRSFALNMTEPRAHDIALRLAAQSSIVASNFRPGVMERWGLSYEAIRAVNPSVIYLTMPMQGSDGPNAAYSGFGSTISALAGLVALSGLPDRKAVGTGTHYPDHVPNPGHALVALLAAIYHRRRTGEGQSIELSQLESTVNVVGPAILEASLGSGVRQRAGNRIDGAAPHGVFACTGEDRWCAISCSSQASWETLALCLDRSEWVHDPRFATLLDRKCHENELEAAVSMSTRMCDRDELVAVLRAHGVAAASVNSSKDVLEDPDLVARGYWHRVEHPVIGQIAIARPPFRMSGNGTSDEPLAPPPLLGEHTGEVARELLGLADAEIAELQARGVLA